MQNNLIYLYYLIFYFVMPLCLRHFIHERHLVSAEWTVSTYGVATHTCQKKNIIQYNVQHRNELHVRVTNFMFFVRCAYGSGVCVWPTQQNFLDTQNILAGLQQFYKISKTMHIFLINTCNVIFHVCNVAQYGFSNRKKCQSPSHRAERLTASTQYLTYKNYFKNKL